MPTRPPSFEYRLRARNGVAARAPRAYARRTLDPTQRSVDRIRNSRRWRKLRTSVLRRDPLCVGCREHGVLRWADQVDHVEPLRARPDLAFVRSNLQGLCTCCHAKKNARERRAGTGG